MERPAIDLDRKALLVDDDLAYLRAKFNVRQAAGHPVQVLIEFQATNRLGVVDKAVEPLVGPEECKKRVLTRWVYQGHEVFQVRDLDDRFGKQQARVPFEVRVLVEETGLEACRREQRREAEVERTGTHPDRVRREIRVHTLFRQPRVYA